MKLYTGNSKNFNQNDDIVTTYTLIDNFNIDIKIINECIGNDDIVIFIEIFTISCLLLHINESRVQILSIC